MEEPAAEKKHSVKFKRNRSARACQVCHARKVRCDATLHIPCTNCLTFGSECRFPEPKERKNSAKHKKSAPAQHRDGREPPSTDAGRKSGAKLDPIAAISGTTAAIDTKNLFKRYSHISYVGSASTAHLLCEDSSAHGSKTHFSVEELLPSSGKKGLENTQLNLDTMQLELLRLRGAFLLPVRAVADSLVDTYFTHIWPLEPIIDKDKFYADYQADRVSLLLLQAVFLAASRVSANELLFDKDGSNYLTSWTFYQRGKALYDANYERDPLAVVQSLILLTKFWEGFDDILGNSFYWTRVAITVAQGYGFHRNLKESFILTPDELKIWKICWWDLYIKDVAISLGFGRPRVIQLEDCDIEMLSSRDFPKGIDPVDVEVFIQSIRLSEITSIVLQEQYSIRAENLKRSKRSKEHLIVTQCDMIMSTWKNNLPANLQYSASNLSNRLSVCMLNLTYFSIVCLIHRSSMAKATTTFNGKSYPSEGIVFQASKFISEIALKLLQSNKIIYCNASIVPVLFIAIVTFLCHLDSHNEYIKRNAITGYQICSDALNETGKNFAIARMLNERVDKIKNDDVKRREFQARLQTETELHHGYQHHPPPAATPGTTTGTTTNTTNTTTNITDFPELYLFTNNADDQFQLPNDFNPTDLFSQNFIPSSPIDTNTAAQLQQDIGPGGSSAIHPEPQQPQHAPQPHQSHQQPAPPPQGHTNQPNDDLLNFDLNLPEFNNINFNNSFSLQNMAQYFEPGYQ